MKLTETLCRNLKNRRETMNLKPLSFGTNENYSRSAGLEIISPRGRAYQTAGVYFPGGLIRTLPEKKSLPPRYVGLHGGMPRIAIPPQCHIQENSHLLFRGELRPPRNLVQMKRRFLPSVEMTTGRTVEMTIGHKIIPQLRFHMN